MKVFVEVNNYGIAKENESKGWYFLADSAVTNTGKPFYLPENLGHVTVSLAPAVKLSRLGKFIASKFAPRYYNEFAPAIHFRLPELEKKLISQELPVDASRSFDKSLFVGNFMPFDRDLELSLEINDRKVCEFHFQNLKLSIDELIEKISVMNTIKIGDILLPGMSDEIVINRGDLLEVKLSGHNSFEVRIK